MTSLTGSQSTALFAALESRGWSWDGGFIYAPHRSIWLLGSDPLSGDLPDFHERMQGRLQRIVEQSSHYGDPQEHRNVVEDTRGLVGALAAMLSEMQT